jgi:SAM-dependent methyltransferase
MPQGTKRLDDLAASDMIQEISPNDRMFGGDHKHYFFVAKSALKNILNALRIAEKTEVGRILDYTCGHGRVTRALQAAFPQAELVAADIDKDGVEYCAKTFGAQPVVIEKWPPNLPCEGGFDLIWCGAFLSHLSEARFRAFLEFLLDKLAEGGILVCTLHGRYAIHRQHHKAKYMEDELFDLIVEDYYYRGFGFSGYKNKKESDPDYGTDKFGISVARPSWTLGVLERMPNVRILCYTEKSFADHHDVFSIVKQTGFM